MTRQRPGWLLDEMASAGRENLDNDHVRRYDSKENAGVAGEIELLQSLGLCADSYVVEFGPGTGQLAIELAPHCKRLIAVDVSSPMLERLRAKRAERHLENVEVVRAGFLSFDLPVASADFVYSRLALHHLPDFWKAVALTRIHALLRRGGVLRLWDVVYRFEAADAETRIEDWCATGRDVPELTPVEDGWGRWEIEEHVRDEHSTFAWILEPMVERIGFVIEQAEYDGDVVARYVLRRR